MDKNIAALLRHDVKTIAVVFDEQPGQKEYIYVTHLPVVKADRVVVDARGELKIAYVVRVDPELAIEPDSNTRFKWVVDVVDMVAAMENDEKNSELEQTCAKAYQSNLRRSFADQVLSGLPDEEKEKINAIVGATKTVTFKQEQ
jgi:hypothetical protein